MATNCGIENEPLAQATFEQKTYTKIRSAGLFIDERYIFLASSPVELIENNGIIEIKFPFTIKEMTP